MAPTEANASPQPIINWSLAMLGSRVLFSANETGLFTELAKRPPQTADEVAQAVGLHPRLARDFLDALVVMGFLVRDDEKYRNSPLAGRFLDPDQPAQYIGGFVNFAQNILSSRVIRLTGALHSGRPQGPDGATKEDLRELYANPAVVKAFADMTTGYSMELNQALAEKFRWHDHGSVADVGCAQGGLLVQVLMRHPHLTGVGFDMPEMRGTFEEYVGKCGLSDRARFEGGDFFTDPIPPVDVIALGNVLADFSDAQRKQILARVHEALRPGGVVLIYGYAPDKRRDDLNELYRGLLLGLTTDGGGTYHAESAAWLSEAAFQDVSEEPLHGATTLIIGRRP